MRWRPSKFSDALVVHSHFSSNSNRIAQDANIHLRDRKQAMNDERQQHVEALAQTAVAHAQQHFGVRLDGSDDSIQAVERILAEIFELVPHSRISRFFNRK